MATTSEINVAIAAMSDLLTRNDAAAASRIDDLDTLRSELQKAPGKFEGIITAIRALDSSGTDNAGTFAKNKKAEVELLIQQFQSALATRTAQVNALAALE